MEVQETVAYQLDEPINEIYFQCSYVANLLSALALTSYKFSKVAKAAPVTIGLEKLDPKCREAIRLHSPKGNQTYPVHGPTVFIDDNSDVSIGWSRQTGNFYPTNTSGEMNAARAIGYACPKVAIVVFSGATGGTERWYIRRNKFTIRHSRDSGYPGDYDKYWGWDTIPFNYDPNKDYGQYPH